MAIELREVGSEDVITDLSWGYVGPGESRFSSYGTYLQLRVVNTGAAPAPVVLSAAEHGSVSAHGYLMAAVGDPSPGVFVSLDTPLDLGSIAVAGEVRVWLDLVVPIDTPYGGLAAQARVVATEV